MVIAVIAILASMLLPALSKARLAAQKIKCTGNLKQLGLINLMYANDSDDWFAKKGTDYYCRMSIIRAAVLCIWLSSLMASD